jgi:hypothetical protein
MHRNTIGQIMGIVLAGSFLFSATASAKVQIEEEFRSELGETMRCRYASEDPSLDQAALRFWLKLRYPYESFGFPGIEDRHRESSRLGFLETAGRNLKTQARVLDDVRSVRVALPLRPLHNAVVQLFEREHKFSRELLKLLRSRNLEAFVESVDTMFGLTPEKKEELESVARSMLAGDRWGELPTLRDQFFSQHVMVDAQGRHYADYHRDFMRAHRMEVHCACIENCR